MKSIIIAAGSGRRIPEFSKLIPKSLIKINKKSLLKRQIDLMRKSEIRQIAIVKGFKSNKINFKRIKYFYNKNYKKNEQLDSLFSANEWFTDDLLITFSDIIYEDSVIKEIIKSKHDFTIAIQKNWKKKYKKRFDHPIDQADKVFIKNDKILDIGKKLSEDKTNGEFLGIFKISKKICNIFINQYKILKKTKITEKLQIHDFFRYLIKKNINIKPTYVNGKYMEIDTYNDFKIAKEMFNER
jgi:choline kinase